MNLPLPHGAVEICPKEDFLNLTPSGESVEYRNICPCKYFYSIVLEFRNIFCLQQCLATASYLVQRKKIQLDKNILKICHEYFYSKKENGHVMSNYYSIKHLLDHIQLA